MRMEKDEKDRCLSKRCCVKNTDAWLCGNLGAVPPGPFPIGAVVAIVLFRMQLDNQSIA